LQLDSLDKHQVYPIGYFLLSHERKVAKCVAN